MLKEHKSIVERIFISLIALSGIYGCPISSNTTPGKFHVSGEDIASKKQTSKVSFYIDETMYRASTRPCPNYNQVYDRWLKNKSGSFNDSKENKDFQDCYEGLAADREKPTLNFLSQALFRRELVRSTNAVVFSKKPANSNNVLIISARVTELVPDVDKALKKTDGITQNLGYLASTAVPYVGIATSTVLAPLGGFLIGFDALTGIPVKYSSEMKRGLIAIDVTVTDAKTGKIQMSFPSRAIYIESSKELGDEDIGSHKHTFRKSTDRDALELAVSEAVKKIKTDLGI